MELATGSGLTPQGVAAGAECPVDLAAVALAARAVSLVPQSTCPFHLPFPSHLRRRAVRRTLAHGWPITSAARRPDPRASTWRRASGLPRPTALAHNSGLD